MSYWEEKEEDTALVGVPVVCHNLVWTMIRSELSQNLEKSTYYLRKNGQESSVAVQGHMYILQDGHRECRSGGVETSLNFSLFVS